ncbi:MAG: dipeptidase [Armatimonadetes bacterium]|nr:dipeptidase [Armatimonadota bacterium]
MLIFDGHNDLLSRLHAIGDHSGASFFRRNTEGHLDLPRMQEGGFGSGFFAVWLPPQQHTGGFQPIHGGYAMPLPPPLDLPTSQRLAIAMSATLFKIEAASDGKLKVVRTVDQIRDCLASGTVAAILHFEGAEAIDTDLNALHVFYQAGLRSLGIVWSRPTAFGHGVPIAFPATPNIGPGLTDAGKRLVRECNQLGIMIDLSHLNEQGFRDVAALSQVPLVATHSNAWALCKSARNLTDYQLDVIRDSDGMVGLNFATIFLRNDGGQTTDTPLETMIRHIDYLVERLGPTRVGFGSDFDGAAIPQAIGDIAGLPKLIDALRKHGYDEDLLQNLAHRNWMRVLQLTLKE